MNIYDMLSDAFPDHYVFIGVETKSGAIKKKFISAIDSQNTVWSHKLHENEPPSRAIDHLKEMLEDYPRGNQ